MVAQASLKHTEGSLELSPPWLHLPRAEVTDMCVPQLIYAVLGLEGQGLVDARHYRLSHTPNLPLFCDNVTTRKIETSWAGLFCCLVLI